MNEVSVVHAAILGRMLTHRRNDDPVRKDQEFRRASVRKEQAGHSDLLRRQCEVNATTLRF